MSAILETIKPETAERLAAQANALGISIDEYLNRLLRDKIPPSETQQLSSSEKASLWREWVESHSVIGAIADDTRESIYQERENNQL
ncbi:MAG: hypothetical protein AB1757_01460 [Acidobacteriota bacterium]